MVEVQDQDKQEAIEKMVKETLGDKWEDKWFWIGLTRANADADADADTTAVVNADADADGGADGEFLWQESQKQLTFTNWAPNEPGRKAGCAGIGSKRVEDTHFFWFDKRCERDFWNSLCEK